MLEVIDDLGLKPRSIAGTSIGALIGACYASGMSGREIRAHAMELFYSRTEFLRRVVTRWPGSIGALFSLTTPALVNPETLFKIVLPETIAKTFDETTIPFKVVATDFYAQEQVVLAGGSILTAVSASSALPALLTPVKDQGRVLIDGGFVNPTPFDVISGDAQFTIAIDVTGKRVAVGEKIPSTMETWIGAGQIMLYSIVSEKLKCAAPDLFVRPDVASFGVLDFYKIEDILAACEPTKEEFKRGIDRLFSGADGGAPRGAG